MVDAAQKLVLGEGDCSQLSWRAPPEPVASDLERSHLMKSRPSFLDGWAQVAVQLVLFKMLQFKSNVLPEMRMWVTNCMGPVWARALLPNPSNVRSSMYCQLTLAWVGPVEERGTRKILDHLVAANANFDHPTAREH